MEIHLVRQKVYYIIGGGGESIAYTNPTDLVPKLQPNRSKQHIVESLEI